VNDTVPRNAHLATFYEDKPLMAKNIPKVLKIQNLSLLISSFRAVERVPSTPLPLIYCAVDMNSASLAPVAFNASSERNLLLPQDLILHRSHLLMAERTVSFFTIEPVRSNLHLFSSSNLDLL
jgi:hypothetical protein